MENSFFVSKIYENSLDIELKKSNGVYYTPKVVVDYIINSTIKKHDIVENPYPKILDISCGCGNFLVEVYDVLYELFEEKIYDLKQKYNECYWKTDNIHNHIISNCIYGADIDGTAIEILKQQLINKDRDLEVERFNLYCCDSLEKNFNMKFDYIIGNPPYIGHKSIDMEYKKFILKEYKDVYRGKSDLYFCFFKKIIDILKMNGIGCIITPRYFLESPSGKHVRQYIRENASIEEIVDFLGASIFKNIGISSCITTFKKQNQEKVINVLRIKDENINIGNIDVLDKFITNNNFNQFTLHQDLSDEEWIILSTEDKMIYNKINEKCDYTLEEICTSFQGIITGCDKAFVINKDDDKLKNVDPHLLKNWIKNKNIHKYAIDECNYKLIYSNDIYDEKEHHKEIENFILTYKEKLLKRRECKNGIRKWYELQWGREKELFEQTKIMYPYKASENRFAIDYNYSFCSADVYSFFIKEEYKDKFSYEYLVGILNSSIYDKYFKINAKKMSRNVYDYYPNKVMKLRIFKDNNYEAIEARVGQILGYIKEEQYEKINKIQEEIDSLVEKSLQL